MKSSKSQALVRDLEGPRKVASELLQNVWMCRYDSDMKMINKDVLKGKIGPDTIVELVEKVPQLKDKFAELKAALASELEDLSKSATMAEVASLLSSKESSSLMSSDNAAPHEEESEDSKLQKDLLTKSALGRMEQFSSTVKKQPWSPVNVTDWLKECIADIKPQYGKRHVIIPVDVEDGTEPDKHPWLKHVKVGRQCLDIINGSVAVLAPGVFLLVACGLRFKNTDGIRKYIQSETKDTSNSAPTLAYETASERNCVSHFVHATRLKQ